MEEDWDQWPSKRLNIIYHHLQTLVFKKWFQFYKYSLLFCMVLLEHLHCWHNITPFYLNCASYFQGLAMPFSWYAQQTTSHTICPFCSLCCLSQMISTFFFTFCLFHHSLFAGAWLSSPLAIVHIFCFL